MSRPRYVLARAGIGLGIGSEAGGDVEQAVGGAPGRVVGSGWAVSRHPSEVPFCRAGGWRWRPVLPTIAGARLPLGVPAMRRPEDGGARVFWGNVTPPEAASWLIRQNKCPVR